MRLLSAFFVLLMARAVTFGLVVTEKPLDPSGYGYTSHDGMQQMFENFELLDGAHINRLTWFGQFSSGLAANPQDSASFNIFLFSSDPEEFITTPEGICIQGVPASAAILEAQNYSALGLGTGYADPLHGGDIKAWTVDLETLFLESGKYWISIEAASSEPGYFLWNHGSGATDGVDVMGFHSPQGVPTLWASSSAPDRDTLAFRLEFINVPEVPNTLVLLAIGFSALVGFARKSSIKSRSHAFATKA